ncbi:hypothetical protein COLO4_31883 [Corchorus olitorius]|uniref:Uncharacterized protein n=1 Tax=Corchorus olitorius TaxID=93759 RepID=A0A1R3H2Z0_9ROSI|nr:hypothetical protein COLO4_31883 [Corchorus olitorius]
MAGPSKHNVAPEASEFGQGFRHFVRSLLCSLSHDTKPNFSQ